MTDEATGRAAAIKTGCGGLAPPGAVKREDLFPANPTRRRIALPKLAQVLTPRNVSGMVGAGETLKLPI